MGIHVLDASAVVAYVSGEPGEKAVAALLTDPAATCYAHTLNLCEVYYGVIERQDMNRRFWQRVGELKSRGRISLPDCFCISLAQELGGEVVTSDHGEFDPLVALGIVPINFSR